MRFTNLVHADNFPTGHIKRICWSVGFILSICGLLNNVISLTILYLSYGVVVTKTMEHSNSLTFPVVSLCNLSPLKKSSILGASNSERNEVYPNATSVSNFKSKAQKSTSQNATYSSLLNPLSSQNGNISEQERTSTSVSKQPRARKKRQSTGM